jgi:hypothetical protein
MCSFPQSLGTFVEFHVCPRWLLRCGTVLELKSSRAGAVRPGLAISAGKPVAAVTEGVGTSS